MDPTSAVAKGGQRGLYPPNGRLCSHFWKRQFMEAIKVQFMEASKRAIATILYYYH